MSKQPKSLKKLLLFHELTFLLLVMLAGAAGWTGIHIWQEASAESQRINTLIQEVQQTRGDLYRQMKELFDAIFLEDPLAMEEYASFSRNAADHFIELRTLATGREELQAINELQQSYEDFQSSTELILERREKISTSELRKSLDVDMESGVLSRYEAAAAQTETLLSTKQKQLAQQLEQSKQTALMLLSIPVLLAGALLLFSHLFLQRAIVRPIKAVLRATTEISAGRLDTQTPKAGTAELSALAEAINQMAEALKLSQEALVKSEKQAAQGALVPMLAHNIRNPLASIRAIAQVANGPEIDADTRESLRDIINTVDRLERWTGALLAYLLPMKTNLSTTNLKNVIHGALAPLQPKLREKSIRIELPDNIPHIPLNADESLLEQALYNLLLNAVDASPTNAPIDVEIEDSEHGVILRMLDRGPGMPFVPDPANQSPGPSTKRFGTGLGIPFAFKVCEALGYEMDFTQRTGGGTVVELIIPRAR